MSKIPELTDDQQMTLGMAEWDASYIREKLRADAEAYEELLREVMYALPVEVVGRMTRLRTAIQAACTEADKLEDYIKSFDPERAQP